MQGLEAGRWVWIGAAVLFAALLGATPAAAQTINGKAVPSYATCVEVGSTEYDGWCLVCGDEHGRHRAWAWGQNRCDQPVSVVYDFTGEIVDKEGRVEDHPGPRTEYNIEPGDKARLSYINARTNSGKIVARSVEPYGRAASNSSSGSHRIGEPTNSYGDSSTPPRASSSADGGGDNASPESAEQTDRRATSGSTGTSATGTNATGTQGNQTTSQRDYEAKRRQKMQEIEEQKAASQSKRRRRRPGRSRGRNDEQTRGEQTREEFHQEHVQKSKESARAYEQKQEAKRQAEERERQRAEQRRRAEAERRAEAARRKRAEEQRKREAFNRWKQQQNEKNAQIAADNARNTANMFIQLGTLMYQGMGKVDTEHAYTGEPTFYVGMEFGYSLLIQPMYFNSEKFDGVDTDSSTTFDYTWPINIDFKLKLGYETEYVGGWAFGKASVGTTLILNSFLFPGYEYGAQVYAGHPNVQGFVEYSRGGRNALLYHYLQADEAGDGYTSISTETLKYGLKFTWGDFIRSYLRIGLIAEGVTGGEDISVQYLSSLDPEDEESLYIPGFFAEIRDDHTFNLFVNFYPSYPFSGERRFAIDSDEAEEYEDGGFLLSIGFHRAIDGFY